jgi:hypothetical protein
MCEATHFTPLYATLQGRPVSEEALALTKHLSARVTAYERTVGARKNERRTTTRKVEHALGAFLAALMWALADHDAWGWVYRSMEAATFSGERVSHRTFKAVTQALVKLGYVVREQGHRRHIDVSFDPGDAPVWHKVRGRASHFRATEALVIEAAWFGVVSSMSELQFAHGLPEPPVILRAGPIRLYGKKIKGRRMKPERTPGRTSLQCRKRQLPTTLKRREAEAVL